MKSHWKGSEIYHFSRSATQNILRRPAIVTDIFEEFQQPFQKFLTAPLRRGGGIQIANFEKKTH